jgi:hypothetical protein
MLYDISLGFLPYLGKVEIDDKFQIDNVNVNGKVLFNLENGLQS